MISLPNPTKTIYTEHTVVLGLIEQATQGMPKECALHATVGVHAQHNVRIDFSKITIDVQGIIASSRITVVAAHEHFVQAGHATI